ncbi:MAG: transcriptional repressor [Nitrospinae bacterium]|nr:transcriptional repressor [Nitrospinota bacterium]
METTHLTIKENISNVEITDLLKRHGITSTLQRVEIAQIMLSRKCHYSAEQVLEKVNRGRSIVSKATIYNTLRLFAEKGIVKEIFADPAKVYYEPKVSGHHHFFNEDTGDLTDIEPGQMTVSGIPASPAGTEVEGVDIIIRVRKLDVSR